MKFSVIIPAEDPAADPAGYADTLIQGNIKDIIVVTAHGNPAAHGRLKELSASGAAALLTCEKGGRGAALKEAFSFLAKNRPDISGAVIASEDGALSCDAIKEIIEAAGKNPGNMIIAGRDIRDKVPSASEKIGRRFSSMLFSFGMGVKLSDPESCFRFIPAQYFSFFAEIKGDGKGYETRMLSAAVNREIPYMEIPLQTGGEEKRCGLKDKIITYTIVLAYFVKFALSSVSSYLIDMGVYALLLALLKNTLAVGSQVLVCTVVSRVISSLFNYIINRQTVFKAADNIVGTTVKYYALVIVKLGVSYGLIYLFTYILGVTGFAQLIIKALVDLVLFVFSYYFQRIWVFKNKKV